MAASKTDYDIIFRDGGTSALTYCRVARGQEGSYTLRHVRAEITQNLLSQSETPALKSRPDGPAMYQSSWAGGARWWKPLIGGADVDTYFQSNHFDTWSEPGRVVPMNLVTDAANTVLHDACVIGVGAGGDLYALGATATDNTSQLDVYIWTPASDAFVLEASYNSGVAAASNPMAMTFDPTDGYFYIISDDDDIERFNPTTEAEDADYITTGFTSYVGANIFMHRTDLMFYSGDQVYYITKATTSTVTVAFNDGMGPEFLSGASFAGSAPIFRETNPKLAVSTPEGIFYVKNVRMGGQPQAWVFRVNKNDAGQWIGDPLAPLPFGSVALSIAYHLGSVVIAATSDWRSALVNDTDELEIELYHYTGGQPGALGVVLGRDALDETPFALLGSSGSLLYIGGHKRLWVYDAIRGGLHTAFEWGTGLANGPYHAMAWVADSDGDSSMIWLGRDRIARQKRDSVADPDLVAAFGDDEAHYVLTSNYFDAGLPVENKRLSKVEILFDAATTNQAYTLQISVDDGSFTDAINESSSALALTSGYARGWANKVGRLFRYKFIYQTKTAAKKALRAILVTFVSGEMVREWEFLFDGSAFRNIDNKRLDPEEFVTAIRLIGEKTGTLAMYDNYNLDRTIDVTADSDDQLVVKVVEVDIIKDKPNEPMVKVIVREDPNFTTAV